MMWNRIEGKYHGSRCAAIKEEELRVRAPWWAFGVKLWETLGVNTHLAPVTLGKYAVCEPPFGEMIPCTFS
jgi:hypothetical protein